MYFHTDDIVFGVEPTAPGCCCCLACWRWCGFVGIVEAPILEVVTAVLGCMCVFVLNAWVCCLCCSSIGCCCCQVNELLKA